MSTPDVLIVGVARTPMTSFVGAFKDVSATELGAIASRGALARAGVDPAWIDHAIFGNVQQTSADAPYASRHIALKAGVPIETPALTVNRLCGSGLQAVINGAQLIRLGEAHVTLTGGTENMSQAPHVVRGARAGLKLGQSKMEDSLWECLVDAYCGCPMGITAENLAAQYGINRECQDMFALRSQQLAARAREVGRFVDEIVPVEIAGRKGPTVVSQDDSLRPETTMEALTRLSPVFKKDGAVTAGNSSGIADGAAALVVASEHAVLSRSLTPLGRLVDWAIVGVDPSYMGIGPAPATRRLLKRTGLALDDIDLIEVNEAFAGQYLAVEAELGLNRDRVNVNGGAIALGHPLGMSGARILLTLLLELRRRGLRRGLATACIGGGQGIAAIIETV
jgi:acetyl-CoA acetyltransferase family protein